MEIILLRHGKPDIPSLKKLSASAFTTWIQRYNVAALSASSKPTHEALACSSDSKAIVCSKLQRSIDSANALDAKKLILSSSVFNEAGLPSANWHSLKVSPKYWAVFFRILWLLGYSGNSESFNEAKNRAVEAAKILIEFANGYEKVIFVGHGVFNRIVAKELRKNGWAGPKNPGSKYLTFGIYSKK
jgi:broad specificity phosphatase PhoE